jgi:hypothetical protein
MSDIVEKFDQVKSILLRRRTIHRSYAAVFGSEEGSTVLDHILEAGFVSKTTFVSGDPEQTLLNEGSRRLALSILKLARTNHKEMILQIERHLRDQGMEM